MLAAAPGSSATVEVALAMIAGSPRNISVGKVMMVPPPARAFINPPAAAAASMMAPSPGVIAPPPPIRGAAPRRQPGFGGCIVAYPQRFRARGTSGSAEVVARHGQHLFERPEPLPTHRDAAVALLQHPLDDQARRAGDQLAVSLQEVGGDDRLRHAGLVLQGEEEETLGGARALADDHRAGGADEVAVAVVNE